MGKITIPTVLRNKFTKTDNVSLRFKQCIFSLFLIFSIAFSGYAQLDDTHYLPPFRQGTDGAGVGGGASNIGSEIYFSTPEAFPFVVNVYYGNSTTPDLSLSGLSNNTPITLDLVSTLGADVSTGIDGIIQLSRTATGVVQTGAGMRFESVNGEKFYANYRIKKHESV